MTVRHWRYWCEGCADVELHTFYDRQAENADAVRWVVAHHGHGTGGFVTPFSLTSGCPRCGSSMEASCPSCGVVAAVLWDGTKPAHPLDFHSEGV